MACVFLADRRRRGRRSPSDWFVAGFEPAAEKIGIPATFAALVIIPLLGNVAENYVALRYAYRGRATRRWP